MRFYFDAPGHEAGFVWLRTDSTESIEVTSGLGSDRTRAELQIRNTPSDLDGQMLMCRKAIAQFMLQGTGTKGLFISQFDETIEPWRGRLFTIAPMPS